MVWVTTIINHCYNNIDENTGKHQEDVLRLLDQPIQ
jgi:hypothetical protein